MASFPWTSSPPLVQLFTALSGSPLHSSSTLRFAGGCVRDFLLNQRWRDVDLATPLSPQDIILKLQDARIPFITPGISHGTITALLNHQLFEITTLRKDVSPDGRRSTVEFIDNWEIDALRRDFTLNALFMDWEGRVYDFVEGVADLKKGCIRFVGNPDLRIQEDYLRILRFFRMYAFYGKIPLDTPALNAVHKHAHKISSLSRERIHQEFFKILSAHNAEKSLFLMRDYKVLKYLSEYFEIPSYVRKLSDPFLKCASLLLHSSHKFFASDLKFFLLSNAEIKRMIDILHYKSFLLDEAPLSFSPAFLFRTKLPLFNDLIHLKAAILGTPPSTSQNILNEAQKTFPHLIFPLTGQDLLSLGIQEGPVIGKILKTIQEKWLESECKLSRKNCLILIKNIL